MPSLGTFAALALTIVSAAPAQPQDSLRITLALQLPSGVPCESATVYVRNVDDPKRPAEVIDWTAEDWIITAPFPRAEISVVSRHAAQAGDSAQQWFARTGLQVRAGDKLGEPIEVELEKRETLVVNLEGGDLSESWAKQLRLVALPSEGIDDRKLSFEISREVRKNPNQQSTNLIHPARSQQGFAFDLPESEHVVAIYETDSKHVIAWRRVTINPGQTEVVLDIGDGRLGKVTLRVTDAEGEPIQHASFYSKLESPGRNSGRYPVPYESPEPGKYVFETIDVYPLMPDKKGQPGEPTLAELIVYPPGMSMGSEGSEGSERAITIDVCPRLAPFEIRFSGIADVDIVVNREEACPYALRLVALDEKFSRLFSPAATAKFPLGGLRAGRYRWDWIRPNRFDRAVRKAGKIREGSIYGFVVAREEFAIRPGYQLITTNAPKTHPVRINLPGETERRHYVLASGHKRFTPAIEPENLWTLNDLVFPEQGDGGWFLDVENLPAGDDTLIEDTWHAPLHFTVTSETAVDYTSQQALGFRFEISDAAGTAWEAGLTSTDVIVGRNGTPFQSWNGVKEAVTQIEDEQVALDVSRDGQLTELEIGPLGNAASLGAELVLVFERASGMPIRDR